VTDSLPPRLTRCVVVIHRESEPVPGASHCSDRSARPHKAAADAGGVEELSGLTVLALISACGRTISSVLPLSDHTSRDSPTDCRPRKIDSTTTYSYRLCRIGLQRLCEEVRSCSGNWHDRVFVSCGDIVDRCDKLRPLYRQSNAVSR